jgi:hypothetical protein
MPQQVAYVRTDAEVVELPRIDGDSHQAQFYSPGIRNRESGIRGPSRGQWAPA